MEGKINLAIADTNITVIRQDAIDCTFTIYQHMNITVQEATTI